ncbi:MAG: hypothetical protein V2A79_14750 [Planctomycetota bacterium]
MTVLDCIPVRPRVIDREHAYAAKGKERRNLLAVCGACEPGAAIAWLRLFGVTFDPRHANPHRRMTPWPVQERAIVELWEAIDQGHDLIIDKSRDMGASWLCLAVFVWWWLFVPDTPFLMVSRKQEYVDGGGDPDTLFWKADYLLAHLPAWMLPRMRRTYMHLANLHNGSVIDGESTNADVARGGRRKAILLDEFAACENGNEILAATADATPCRVYNSTPKGRANTFADVRFSGKCQVVTLHWSDHPTKGRGAVLVPGPDGKQRWTSPWYESECARRTSRKEIAQELDIDYLASGDAFFDLDVLSRMRGDCKAPLLLGEVVYEVSTRAEGRSYALNSIRWAPDHGRRRFALWEAPSDHDQLRRDDNYVAFADISHGVGSSNSVLKVASRATRAVVAQLTCSDSEPATFAEMCVAVCRWVGGQTPCLLGWEANGPGQVFGRRVWQLGYNCVLGNPDLNQTWEPSRPGIGWTSTVNAKELLFGELRAAWARGELIESDLQTIVEAEQYIYAPTGVPMPAGEIDDPAGARKAHGDRVVSAAGLVLCLRQQPAATIPQVQPPERSPAARRQDWERQQRARNEW